MITRKQLQAILAELDAVLPEIAKRQGVALATKGGKYGPVGEIKIEVAALNESGEAETEEAQAWKLLAPAWGLDPEGVGKQFIFLGQSYELLGLKRRASKNPVLAKRVVDGKRYVFPVEAVKELK